MDHETFLMNKLDVTNLIEAETDQRAVYAASMAMDMAYIPPPPSIDFLYRDDWLAFPPVNRELLPTPVRYVRLCQTGGGCCGDREDCIARVRGIQETQVLVEGLEDISYNFLVDHEGRVYEGRGWHVQAQRKQKYECLKYIGVDICLIGNWRKVPVPEKTIKAVGDLLKYGVESKYVEKDYLVLGYRETVQVQQEKKRKEKKKNVEEEESEWEESE